MAVVVVFVAAVIVAVAVVVEAAVALAVVAITVGNCLGCTGKRRRDRCLPGKG